MIRQRSTGVAQEHHLTIEQLSAFLDKQLSRQEQVECEVHLQRCPQCQSLLADLRQTVNILHALPQPELPRSFVLPLPAHAPAVAERSQRERRVTPVTPITRRRSRSWPSSLQRSTRVISTIAAVLGIFFIMSSLLTGLVTLPHGGASSTTSSPAFSSAQSLSPVATPPPAVQFPNAASQGRSPHGTATNDQEGVNAPTPVPAPVNTVKQTPRPTPSNSNGQQGYAQTPSLPPILDLSMPEGRAGVGFLLLILGILGVLLTRRKRARSW